MALQDKFDSQFTEKLLKRTLVKPSNASAIANANDNNYELTKSNLVTLSNSFTSLQNAFNKIYAHTINVRNLHQYDEKRMASISRQNSLENKIAPASAPVTSTDGTGNSLTSTAATLDELASSVEKLNEKMKKINLNGGIGGSNLSTLPLDFNSRTKIGRWGGRALGAAGVGLDAYGRYQEGQSAGQIATGVGGGLAGAALGAKAGAAAGGAIGAFFFGAGAVPGAAIGGFLGGIGGYFAGSSAGDAAYNTLNPRAMGGGVKAGGAYLIGERGPEVLMLGGLSGKVIANGRRGSESQADKNLNAAADKSSRAAAKVTKGQPIGPTSYSSKFSNYLSSLFSNMPGWLNRIKDFLGIGMPGPGVLGPGQYAGIGDLSGVTGDWKNDTEFLRAVDDVARNYDIDANDLLGLMYNESAGTMSPTIRNSIGATGLFQFMPQFFDTDAVARMSRAEQVRFAEERIFAANRLPRGANAGQLYAAVFLPGIARSQGWQGVLARRGDKYYSSNAGLDKNNDGQIDYGDLATTISGHRVSLGLGPSPSLSGGVMSLSGFVAPVSGPAGSGFRTADRPKHEGIDFPIPSGSPVYAARAGTIRRTGIDSGGYGNFIEIDHGGGTTTRYGHLREFLVTSGSVNAGQIIAYSGGGANDPQPGRGRSTGAHLHFELRINGNPVDPSQYLPAATGRVAPTPVSMGEIFGRMLIPNLPAGYKVEGRSGRDRDISVIVTPNGTSFPRSVRSASEISNFSSLSRESQNQITEYFRIVGSR